VDALVSTAVEAENLHPRLDGKIPPARFAYLRDTFAKLLKHGVFRGYLLGPPTRGGR
jgi:hypothetical protein